MVADEHLAGQFESGRDNQILSKESSLFLLHLTYFCGMARKAVWKAGKNSDTVARTELGYEEEIRHGMECKQPPPEVLQKCSQ